jgi:hypothetical protein
MNKNKEIKIEKLLGKNLKKLPITCDKLKVVKKPKYENPYLEIVEFNTREMLPYIFHKSISRTINLTKNEPKQ